jgi:dienelactone hydrolase
MARIGELRGSPTRVRTLGRAGLQVLLDQEEVDGTRVAAMGWCFGGTLVLDLARDAADLKAVIGFHPGLAMNNAADAARITGKVLMFCGAADTLIGKDARDAFEAEMTEAGVADWRMEVLGGVGHSFTNVTVDAFGMPGLAYHEQADRRTWAAALDLLTEVL